MLIEFTYFTDELYKDYRLTEYVKLLSDESLIIH